MTHRVTADTSSLVTYTQNCFRALLVFVITLGFAACTQSKGISKGVALKKDAFSAQVSEIQLQDSMALPSAEEPGAGLVPLVPIPVPTGMIGVWVKSCKMVADEDEEKGRYSVYEEMKIGAKGELTIDRYFYEGKRCRDRKMVQHVRFEGGAILSTDLMQAEDNFKSFITHWDQEAINELNSSKACGKDDWKYGVQHEDCLSQQGKNVLKAQYSLENQELAIFACESGNLEECSSEVYWLGK